MTLIDKSVAKWYEENMTQDDYDVMATLFTVNAFQLIEDEIINELEDDNDVVELDNDFGDYYWNGSRMVPKPGMDD